MMLDYIDAIKRKLRDQYHFVPSGGTPEEPLFDNVPDGEYPMEIDGELDHVKILKGRISCCNF